VLFLQSKGNLHGRPCASRGDTADQVLARGHKLRTAAPIGGHTAERPCDAVGRGSRMLLSC